MTASAEAPPTFTQTVLETGADGRARFTTRTIALDAGDPGVRLSALRPAGGYRLRASPVGFASPFHCTASPQWVFVLAGRIEIGLHDGSWRAFGPGEHFYAADTLPPGEVFDPRRHGHRSRQAGAVPLLTLFLVELPGAV